MSGFAEREPEVVPLELYRGAMTRVRELEAESNMHRLTSEARLKSLAEQTHRAQRAEARVTELRGLLDEVANSPATFDDERIGYVEIQVPRESLNLARAALQDIGRGGSSPSTCPNPCCTDGRIIVPGCTGHPETRGYADMGECDDAFHAPKPTLPAEPEPASSKSQPPPTGDGQPITEQVIADLRLRSAEGTVKYGTVLRANNGRDALVDAYQEALDLCQYLRQEITERAMQQEGGA